MKQVAFTQMKDGTAEDYQFLQALEHDYIRSLPDRLLTALEALGDSLPGYQVSRLEHSLQSATRAQDDGADIDIPAAYLEFKRGDASLGTYLVSPQLNMTQTVDVGGKRYEIALRFERGYRPYTVKLIDFKHDRFVGTETARNFSSLVRLTDPSERVDREVLISMNNPLRYAGETFYQASFAPDDSGTVLQVVRNPGWLLPYVSCALVALGLLVHFGSRLIGSVRRKVS
jgi:hypothetical protein